jgi:Domain of unknown function (DUF4126)
MLFLGKNRKIALDFIYAPIAAPCWTMAMAFNLDTILEILLAIGLSTAAGFRVFVPLLIMSAASVLGHWDLPTKFDWIENPQALALFSGATVLEIIGYSIPWFDHLLDIVATPAAIVAGTVVTASFAPEMEPLTKWSIALITGGGAAGLTKGLLNLLRGGSTAATGGLANPLFALLELVMAVGLSLLAITLPIVAGAIGLGIFGFALYKITQFLRGLRKPTGAAS